MERTQEEKLLAGLTHAAVFFFPIGLIINIVLYIVYRQKSTFVGRHVKQALGLQVLWMLVNAVFAATLGVGIASFVTSIAGIGSLPSLRVIGPAVLFAFIRGALGIGFLVLVVLAAIKGFKGEEHKYPIIGDFVDGINP